MTSSIMMRYRLRAWQGRVYRVQIGEETRVIAGHQMNVFLTRAMAPIRIVLSLLSLKRGRTFSAQLRTAPSKPDVPIKITRE